MGISESPLASAFKSLYEVDVFVDALVISQIRISSEMTGRRPPLALELPTALAFGAPTLLGDDYVEVVFYGFGSCV